MRSASASRPRPPRPNRPETPADPERTGPGASTNASSRGLGCAGRRLRQRGGGRRQVTGEDRLAAPWRSSASESTDRRDPRPPAPRSTDVRPRPRGSRRGHRRHSGARRWRARTRGLVGVGQLAGAGVADTASTQSRPSAAYPRRAQKNQVSESSRATRPSVGALAERGQRRSLVAVLASRRRSHSAWSPPRSPVRAAAPEAADPVGVPVPQRAGLSRSLRAAPPHTGGRARASGTAPRGASSGSTSDCSTRPARRRQHVTRPRPPPGRRRRG